MLQLKNVVIVNKKIFIVILLLSLFMLTSCSKKQTFFTNNELDNFGLNGLCPPNNAVNYYNKSKNNMLFCYMTVSNDDDVRSFVLNILNMLDNSEIYKEYGYAKSNDMYDQKRKIYLSKNINDYQINTNNYSEDSVSFNSYGIYYSLYDKSKENTMFVISVISYTEENTNYLAGYNLIISVTKKNYSNYTVITE